MLNKKLVLTSAFVVMAFAQSFAADLNSLIPAKANLIAKFNIEKICAIPELKAKFEEFKASQPVANTSTTDELYKDTKSAMFFLDLDTANNTDQNNIFAGALLDGKYDVSKITEAIKKDHANDKGLKIENEGNCTCFTFTDEKGMTGKVAFLDSENIVVGTVLGVDAVKAVKFQKAETISANKPFAEAVAKITNNSSIALTTAMPQAATALLAAQPEAQPLSKMQYIRLELDKPNDLKIIISADADTKENAASASQYVTKFINEFKKSTGANEALSDLLNNAKVTDKDNTMTIESSVSDASLKKLIESNGSPNPQIETK